jgi:hypothetical protein
MSKKTGKKLGRKPILEINPAIKDEILGYITSGAYMDVAFRAAGISDDNYYKWMKQAERGNPIFVEFFAALKKAEAAAELSAATKMRDDPKAFLGNATYLERRHRDRWGRSDRHVVDQNVNIRIETVDYNKLLKQMNKGKQIDVTPDKD